MDFDLAIVLTAAGATVGAGLITGIVEVLKRLGPIGTLVSRGPATVAFILGALLVAAAYASVTTIGGGTEPVTVEGVVAAVIACFGIAAISTKAYDVASARVSSSS